MGLKSSVCASSTKKHTRCPSPNTSCTYCGSNCPCSGCHCRKGLGELNRAELFVSSSLSGLSLAATSNSSACSGFFVLVALILHLPPELASSQKDHLGRLPSGPPFTVRFSDKLLGASTMTITNAEQELIRLRPHGCDPVQGRGARNSKPSEGGTSNTRTWRSSKR